MNTQPPTSKEIEELVSFLPRLYEEGFSPIEKWGGGTKDEEGVITMPWPVYDEVVKEFVEVASRECWRAYGYRPEEAARMLKDDNVVITANLDQIKIMLTFCIRGERFCDGHWNTMIKGGQIKRLLERLSKLISETT
jgi:hypothetical protein